MESSGPATRLDHDQLETFSAAVLREAGLGDDHAATVAEGVVDASRRGIDTHGVVRLDPYVEAVERGGINPDPDVSVTESGAGAAVVDGDDGPGQVTTMRGMETAMALAEEAGSAFVGVRNSNHFGAASFYTNHAAERGYIAIAMTHAGPSVAPFGGADPYLGTNPLSFSLPSDDFPITLDMATSVTAKGSVMVAEDEGREIPPEWAIDEEGDPITDPEAFHALRPMGGPKGYGLAFFVDAMCGVLLDADFGDEVAGMYDSLDAPQRAGHVVCAIDVDAFTDLDGFVDRMGRLATGVKGVRTAEDVDEVLLPGEPEARTKTDRLEAGIPVSGSLLESLEALADRYDLELT
ncbi:Ldh family oxidoreductase [Halococcus hamelinensis]|uniref:Malate dehydrogenase n=1 Tax=Halococcus hamelinensis 100A6 TaxID=1132509 RepID=M0M776_9EURY|nr:Ldh family oxidoreductase [Halococcus hamelinensis]EMA41253.1 malate dehydrogenase [Halococcus hamelinensis 100A6]